MGLRTGLARKGGKLGLVPTCRDKPPAWFDKLTTNRGSTPLHSPFREAYLTSSPAGAILAHGSQAQGHPPIRTTSCCTGEVINNPFSST